jgi:hypothetical protein
MFGDMAPYCTQQTGVLTWGLTLREIRQFAPRTWLGRLPMPFYASDVTMLIPSVRF